MFELFKKEPETILEAFKANKLENNSDLAPGQLELEVLKGERQIERANTDQLDAAIIGYFAREWDSIGHIESYFKNRLAIEATHNFEYWLYANDRMDRPMLGLSILLMRDSTVLEAVKFGIYLSKFYDIQSAPLAKRLILDYGVSPHFTYYSCKALLTQANGSFEFYNMGSKLEGTAKEIYELLARELLEERGIR